MKKQMERTTVTEKNNKMLENVKTIYSVKIAAVWDFSPFSLVDTDRRFKRAYRFHRQAPRNFG
jgi:hypothetical protein